ncbi:protein translocase subunit yajC [Desulfitobacterium dichloroeliminans LMG P-21439]|uniref:Protein translocase subunit yajC n=1 Tax=Desulfitobacterium dichloroeliminans (strain LMG P-21439 / DCA1) TaxID=871963 RepID=L0F7Y6_DESDL|nr:preprotein translocase subunit YajC [Desulfitobacterium dichloroeliminans]AGA69944.1 protein translocase subunit yajC [Desulfitobacterium dichloroeliminans LMG P-21439]
MDSGTTTLLLYMAVFFAIMYFFMIRPQQKQQKQRQAMLTSLKVNDKIITAGGIHGKIKKVKEDSVIVLIADKVEIELNKSGVGTILNREITVEKRKFFGKKDNEKTKEVDNDEESETQEDSAE